ncbi:glucose-6-phosphate dehydrogenase [Nostoc sp. UIC 10607]|uniref:glucose-6-phosphate dehydrogenase n=1 Tax=Nostoc sp. UIC 10607 TaxID=3045935 RepID=UPI0039A0CFAF
MAALLSDALVFFGITSDLAYKKIFPALQAMIQRGHFDIPIIGVGRRDWSIEQLQSYVRKSLEEQVGVDEAAFQKLCSLLYYIFGDYSDRATYDKLCQVLQIAEAPLYYLAIPPSLFATVVEGLGQSSCVKNGRVMVEKPFGRDLESARILNCILHSIFPESHIFRIDHYLGKEPVQNLLYTRFANSLLEPIWHRVSIASIQITMAEKFGIDGRGQFYEETGAIRDVVQNHLLQVTACLMMDPPINEQHEAIRDERARLLKSIDPIEPSNVVRGQYKGYASEPGVAPDSKVETFAAVKLNIDTWRWASVPIYIRAGKCLPSTTTEVVVRLKRPPQDVFGERAFGLANYFYFRLSPNVLTAIGIRSKTPGDRMVGSEVGLVAQVEHGNEMNPYERLFEDAMKGDSMLFARQDEVEAQWQIVAPILDRATPVYEYAPHTWGPPLADRMIPPDGGWHNPNET